MLSPSPLTRSAGLLADAQNPYVIQNGLLLFMGGLMTYIGPMFFLFISLNFVLAILAIPFTHLKAHNAGAPGVPTDLKFLFRSAFDVRSGHCDWIAVLFTCKRERACHRVQQEPCTALLVACNCPFVYVWIHARVSTEEDNALGLTAGRWPLT